MATMFEAEFFVTGTVGTAAVNLLFISLNVLTGAAIEQQSVGPVTVCNYVENIIYSIYK